MNKLVIILICLIIYSCEKDSVKDQTQATRCNPMRAKTFVSLEGARCLANTEKLFNGKFLTTVSYANEQFRYFDSNNKLVIDTSKFFVDTSKVVYSVPILKPYVSLSFTSCQPLFETESKTFLRVWGDVVLDSTSNAFTLERYLAKDGPSYGGHTIKIERFEVIE